MRLVGRGNLKRIHINLKIKEKSRFDFSVEYLLEYRFEKSEVGVLGRVEGTSLPELCLQELTGACQIRSEESPQQLFHIGVLYSFHLTDIKSPGQR